MQPAAPRVWRTRILFALALAAIVVVGWDALRFTCDDAFINFRYVSNSMLGRGFVWNPAPFAPVEGYTSLLWLSVLRGVWTVTGLEPPVAVDYITLFFGFATLFVGWRLLLRMRLPAVLIGLVLLATATSRVFLTWLTSGFETSMFVFLMTSWVWIASTNPQERPLRWAIGLTTLATLVALTRPDGLLCVGASVALLLWRTSPARGGSPRVWLGSFPLLVIVGHFLWRRSVYGEWLPNTYYAKHTAWWPESGLRYAASFIVENGVWFWLALAACWVALEAVRGNLRWRIVRAHIGVVCAALVLLTHFGFYTFKIGGDIFEYRVYAHLTLLLFVSGAWMAHRSLRNTKLSTLLVVLLITATHTVAWLHHAGPNKLRDRLPQIVHPIIDEYRDWQTWLHAHMVCQRRETHNQFVDHLRTTSPTRAEGQLVTWDERPIFVCAAAGVVGWSMPHVGIIDVYGLNDAVVARNPAPEPAERLRKLEESQRAMFAVLDANGDGKIEYDELRPAFVTLWPTLAGSPETIAAGTKKFMSARDADSDGTLDEVELFASPDENAPAVRKMGHERVPPAGYVKGFRANTRIVDKKIVVEPREPPLTDSEIIEHERLFRDAFRNQAR